MNGGKKVDLVHRRVVLRRRRNCGGGTRKMGEEVAVVIGVVRWRGAAGFFELRFKVQTFRQSC